MPRRKRVPPMPSRKLVKLMLQAGAEFDREGKGDHSIYQRVVEGVVLKAPVRMGQRELRPEYCLMVFRQLGLTDKEIDSLL
jgi:predicted RNA binding protein YcfA (HicA-like mRNA interferase family)